MTEPVLADQSCGLQPLLAWDQTEMGVDHVHRDAVEIDRGPDGAAGFQPGNAPHAGQGAFAHQPLGPESEQGVAILFRLDQHGGVEVEAHVEPRRDRLGLIDAAGAGAADVEFLQADYIRLVLGDDGDDPGDVEPLIGPDAAMHIVGEKTGHEVRSSRYQATS